jgi:hypothetical protein
MQALARVGVALGVLSLSAAAVAWQSKPVANDALLRMPGTQPGDGVKLEAPTRCFNCHDLYDATVDIGAHWRGAMMAQAGRDPIFWSAVTVALQDSIWAVGRPNAGDLCLRCHSPQGWLGGRSDPVNGALLVGADFDGIDCDSCHRRYDSHFEDTYAGTREGSDWTGYWDESGASATPSGPAATTTLAADRLEAAKARLFNGSPFYDGSNRPVPPGYTESTGGQYFVAGVDDKRASFADAGPKHQWLYSRLHKSRAMCATCHDVSNPVLANFDYKDTAPGVGTTVLPSEAQPAAAFFHVERTFSEFTLSSFGVGGGAAGRGAYAPGVFATSHPGNVIATCQDCHMPDRVGVGANKTGIPVRPTGSVEHPKSGQPLHDQTGGNVFVPWLLASTVAGSSNYDATNASLMRQGAAVLTLDLAQGEALDAGALLAASNRGLTNLTQAATIAGLSYDAGTGALSFRVENNTGHKLISGFPEGRRMFVNVRVWQGSTLVREINPYDATAATLKGLDPGHAPNSPALGPNEEHRDELVYEVAMRSTLTGEDHSFHMALATGRYKDNRIPPVGFRIGEAAARLAEPVWGGASAPGYFTAAEYAGGYDQVDLLVPTGATGVEVSLYYQTTSREFVEFLRDEIKGTASTLTSPTPSGETQAYVAQTDPFFAALKAWGDTIFALWDHNRSAPGIAPVLMTKATVGTPAAVDLLAFSAARVAGGVALTWQTGSESACGVFTILRCDRGLGDCAAVTDHEELPGILVPCQGSPAGWVYAAEDATAAPERGYSYFLREHDTVGGARDFGPALVGPAAAAGVGDLPAHAPAPGGAAAGGEPSAVGCAVAAGAPGLPALALLAWVLLRRRRRAPPAA